MATVLSNVKSTYGSPYCYYSVNVNVVAQTPTSVTVKWECTCRLANSASYLGTGKGINVNLYLGGWRTLTIKSTSSSWSGTGAHSVGSGNITIARSPGQSYITGIYFYATRTDSYGNACEKTRVGCANVGISNTLSLYNSVSIAAGTPTQRECAVTLSGLPSACGYATTVNFYNGSTLCSSVSKAASSTIRNYPYTFTGLLPNTTYTFKTLIKYGSTTMNTQTVTVTTPQETGTIAGVAGGTYVTVNVTGMFDIPNYDRVVEFWYRRAGSTDYTLYQSVSAQGSTASANIVGLVSNQAYEFKVNIKNGTTIEKTLTLSKSTIQDTNLIPTAFINGITQRLGTRNCTINWSSDKEVSGTVYTLMCKKSTASTWVTLATLETKPHIVESPYGNENVNFKIVSSNTAVVAATTNESNIFTLYVRDDFLWDTAKTQGEPLTITANEWNRLRDYVITKHPTSVIPLVRAGDPITAETYNTMKNAIDIESIEDKSIGDAITASDIDALRVNINA